MKGYQRALALALAAAALFGASAATAKEDYEIADAKFLPANSSDKRFITKSRCTSSATQTFAGVTSWDVCFDAVSRFGLIIRLADFRTRSGAPWIRTLQDARLSEIFVPYHAGTPRFFDISGFSFPLMTLSVQDCPAPHVRLGGGKVCKEVRDRGLAWKDSIRTRRGKEMILWSVLDATNYKYVIEWTFRDDGSIMARAGSTGPKVGGPDDTAGHMHNFSWRIDMDLNGPDGDSIYFQRHVENLSVTPSTGSEIDSLLTTEVGLEWDAKGFSVLNIVDATLKNGRNRQSSYQLAPLRSGTARHTEPHMKKDFWVTRYSATELFAKDVDKYTNGESLNNQDVVIWYTTSAHHEDHMRDEDRDTVPVLWVGFELLPSNLFDRTPFYQ